jgi:hypothetical protein
MLPPIWRSAFQRPGATFWVPSQAVDRFASKAARGEGGAATGVSTTRRGLRTDLQPQDCGRLHASHRSATSESERIAY